MPETVPGVDQDLEDFVTHLTLDVLPLYEAPGDADVVTAHVKERLVRPNPEMFMGHSLSIGPSVQLTIDLEDGRRWQLHLQRTK